LKAELTARSSAQGLTLIYLKAHSPERHLPVPAFSGDVEG